MLYPIKTDTFTISSVDDTTKQVAFTIHGINDAAVIGTPTLVDLTEDASSPMLAAPHSEARVDGAGPNATLQIDVDGDGQMGANDIEVHLTNYTGTLHDSNFIIS